MKWLRLLSSRHLPYGAVTVVIISVFDGVKRVSFAFAVAFRFCCFRISFLVSAITDFMGCTKTSQ
jgi:hypothetical protein